MEGATALTGGLPGEIVRFFRARGGHSLIVRGAPGIGKTMFALQLAYELRDTFVPLYMSPRVSLQALLRQFPSTAPTTVRKQHPRAPPPQPTAVTCPSCGASIEGTVKEGPIRLTCSACGNTQRFAGRTELNRLIGSIQEPEHTRPIPLDLPEIETAYDAVDENFARYPHLRTLVLIDPIDALQENYAIEASRLINALQQDFVENSGVSTVYVASSPNGTNIDPLVDGLVGLSSTAIANPHVRMLKIEKLRGREVQQSTYFLRVHDGRLWEIGPDLVDRMSRR